MPSGLPEPARLVRLYGLGLGTALLLEGGLLLALDALHAMFPQAAALPFATGDVRHNSLHVVWGVVILGLLATSRSARRASTVALVFGVFYTLLGIVGVLVDRPFGLLLGPGENVFHLTVGPLALLLGVWSANYASSASAPPSSRKSAATASSASELTGSDVAGSSPPR
jgi:hypothetical protein